MQHCSTTTMTTKNLRMAKRRKVRNFISIFMAYTLDWKHSPRNQPPHFHALYNHRAAIKKLFDSVLMEPSWLIYFSLFILKRLNVVLNRYTLVGLYNNFSLSCYKPATQAEKRFDLVFSFFFPSTSFFFSLADKL